jgi:hypothetical protein
MAHLSKTGKQIMSHERFYEPFTLVVTALWIDENSSRRRDGEPHYCTSKATLTGKCFVEIF